MSVEHMKHLIESEDAGFAPGYCANCRRQEISNYGTVLSHDYCERLDIDYYSAHTDACKQAKCVHLYWYRSK